MSVVCVVVVVEVFGVQQVPRALRRPASLRSPSLVICLSFVFSIDFTNLSQKTMRL